LLHLNENKNGRLLSWLNRFDGDPRIAWYPSVGQDFRDLLYHTQKSLSCLPPPKDA